MHEADLEPAVADEPDDLVQLVRRLAGDLRERSSLAARNYRVWASASTNRLASFTAVDTRTGVSANSQWIHLEIPIPSSYNPPPGQDWWKLQYVTGPATITYDTVTVAVGLKGGPVHLVP